MRTVQGYGRPRGNYPVSRIQGGLYIRGIDCGLVEGARARPVTLRCEKGLARTERGRGSPVVKSAVTKWKVLKLSAVEDADGGQNQLQTRRLELFDRAWFP